MLHILFATDGSPHALAAARFVKTMINPAVIGKLTIVTVMKPAMVEELRVGLDKTIAHEYRVEQVHGHEAQPPVTIGYWAMPVGRKEETWADWEHAVDGAAQNMLTECIDLLGEFTPNLVTLVRIGSPVNEIVRVAQTEAVDLIVLGSHGWGEVRSILQRSVADRVLHRAPCPVLIVRPNQQLNNQ
jgi:nucleotide-binding universal stress UspA family protein